ncbi:lysis protein [Xenorhabdus sp. SGI246]|uniref:lysis protein n=1 Tax=Xenorhabdus sp. SGI246 TaxID=3158263 RepID=UPI00349F1E8B
MKLNSQYFTFGVMGLLAGMLWFYYSEYQDKAEEYRRLKRQYDEQIIAIDKQRERIKHLTELDKTHTQELAHTKTEIDSLRADVAAGRRKLHIKATCPVYETVTSSGVVTPAPSNSLEKLDQLFSISEKASSTTGKTEIFAGVCEESMSVKFNDW